MVGTEGSEDKTSMEQLHPYGTGQGKANLLKLLNTTATHSKTDQEQNDNKQFVRGGIVGSKRGGLGSGIDADGPKGKGQSLTPCHLRAATPGASATPLRRRTADSRQREADSTHLERQTSIMAHLAP